MSKSSYSSDVTMSLDDIKMTRRKFDEEKQYLAKGLLAGDEEKNEIVLELHFLMNDLNQFFEEFLDTRKSIRQVKLFSGQMPTIIEGPSDNQISSSTLNNRTGFNSRGSNSQTERRKPQTSIDNLHQFTSSRVHTVTPQKHTEYQEICFKYQKSLNNLNNYKEQCSKLQKIVLQYKSQILQLQKRCQQYEVQRNYCMDLLMRNNTKNQKLQNQNKLIRQSLYQYEDKCKQLSEQVVQKSELLDQIKQFLKTQDQSSNSDQVVESEFDYQNQRLSIQITNINKKLQELIQQNNRLNIKKHEMQKDISILIKDNKQFCQVIQQLQKQVISANNKNKQQIKIEQGKQINDLVHKQNKHLLQINYELSNKIYQIQKQNQKLNSKFQNSLMNTKQSFSKSPNTNMTNDQTIINNHLVKSKLSSDKNNTGSSFFERTSIHQDPKQQKILYYQQNYRLEKNKNLQLEGKVNQLLIEMESYQRQLQNKRKQIDQLNISLSKRNNRSFNQSRVNNISKQEGQDLRLISQVTQSRLSEDNYMSLKQFNSRFEPSLMDILFIMLRVSELSDIMINKNKIYGIFPDNIFLILDDPDRPQNIHVKIQKQSNLSKQETYLFQAPQIVINEIYSPNESSLVWNIGMIFYYLIYKQPYFSTLQEFIDQQRNVQLDKQKFPEAENIIEGMLERDPQMRISLKEVLEGIASQINKMFEEE